MSDGRDQLRTDEGRWREPYPHERGAAVVPMAQPPAPRTDDDGSGIALTNGSLPLTR